MNSARWCCSPCSDMREAAAAIHPVLDVGPGWDWKTMGSLYPNVDIYATQLRALEAARDKEPKAADLYFLLGYHYLTFGHAESALSSSSAPLELSPKTPWPPPWSPRFLPATPSRPATRERLPRRFPRPAVVGHWTAAGPKSATYSMNLRNDGTFTWAFHRGSRKAAGQGRLYGRRQRAGHGARHGRRHACGAATKGADGLHFKMVGGARTTRVGFSPCRSRQVSPRSGVPP